jgi:hypothetical protein
MMQIPLSQIGSPEVLSEALEAYRKALADHRMGEPDQPSPVAHELLDQLILRIPESGPVESRGPDRFEIAPYEIVDDTPPAPPPPTLAERKQLLLFDLHQGAQAAIDKILSQARARLLAMEYGEAAIKPVKKRTATDKAKMAEFMAFSKRAEAIHRISARAAVAIEDLTDTDINDWTIPTFE